MEINFGKFLMTIINFIILVLILKYFFWNKIKQVIDERENLIEDKMLEAEENAGRARKLRVDNERLLKSVKEEGKKLREEEKKKAEKIYEDILSEAHKESDIIKERAKIEIQRETQKAEYELKQQVVDLALMLSSKALEEDIDEDKHRQLIDKFIDKVGI